MINKIKKDVDTKEFTILDKTTGEYKKVLKKRITYTELNNMIQEMIQKEFLNTNRKFILNRPGRSIEKEQPIMWVNHPDKYRQYKQQLLESYFIG